MRIFAKKSKVVEVKNKFSSPPGIGKSVHPDTPLPLYQSINVKFIKHYWRTELSAMQKPKTEPMKLEPRHLKIITGDICPYCGNPPQLVTGAIIYPHIDRLKDDLFYHCAKCNAWVGVHSGTTKPKGRLADKALRECKILAHKYFDAIWKERRLMKRKAAYLWLSERLGIPPQYTHIGMFGCKTCLDVADICRQALNDFGAGAAPYITDKEIIALRAKYKILEDV